jgi:hypothetical protein
MKGLIAIIVSSLMLSGCAGMGMTNDFASTNTAIAEANAAKYRAYTEGMRACGNNAACQVGISMALATGAGDQKMIQPERTAEVLAAFVPFASLGLQAFDMIYGGGPNGNGSAGYVVTGDNNTFSGNGNNLESTGGSTLNSPFSSSNAFSWDQYNRTYSQGTDAGTVSDGGLTDPLDPVVTGTDPVTVTAD